MTFDDWFWQKCVDPAFRHRNKADEELCRESWFESWRLATNSAEREKDAYREAGARLLQAFQKRFCFIEDTMEDCLKTVDMEAELILKGE